MAHFHSFRMEDPTSRRSPGALGAQAEMDQVEALQATGGRVRGH
jgi:hypothetical protein